MSQRDLDGYELLLCVTGGIACYKAADLASKLVQSGAGVTVAMTDSAQKFIAPLTFQSLTGRAVFTSVWQSEQRHDPQHIALTDRADLMIIAPATANIIGKIASGIADDLVSSLAMTASSACPILLAPAMNTRMWESPAVQANMERLKGFGLSTVGPGEGWLACRTVGKGRMAEPTEILAAAKAILLKKPPKKATSQG
jgi:phosphopantothenoylcysteine decarboxylase/phosphopantothenate--cysteine ligase